MRLIQCINAFLKAQSYSANTVQTYRNRLLALSRYEDDVNTPLHEMTPEQIREALRHIKGNHRMMKSVLSLVERYFNWLEEEGIDVSVGRASLARIDVNAITEDRTRLFFYSTQQIISKLDADAEYAAKISGRLKTDFRMPVAVLLLSWVGFKVPEIANVKKSNIHKDNTITMHGEMVSIDPEITERLMECATAVGYTWRNGYTVCLSAYRESQYLIRTSERRKASEQYIRWIVSDFNSQLHEKSEPYKIDKVYWSGVFARAYQKEIELGGFPKDQDLLEKLLFFGKLFNEDYIDASQVRLRLKEYELYTSILRDMGN